MDLFELEQEQTLTREQAAARLHALADEIASNNSLEFLRGNNKITVAVPAKVEMSVEVEIGDDGGEIEIELSW